MQQTVDPYAMLQLSKQFTLEQLKANYKRLALQLHPDKNNPTTTVMFQILTNCYKTLLKEWKLKQTEKPHHDLRDGSRTFLQEQQQRPMMRTDFMEDASGSGSHSHSKSPFPSQSPSQSQPKPQSRAMPNVSGNNFDVGKFNRVFEGNRVQDAYQEGYEAWLRQQEEDAAAAARNKNTHIIAYKTPQALPAAKNSLSYYELGIERVTNHSADNLTQKQIQYMDLVAAHTTDRLIDPDHVKQRREYRTIQELENDRANASFQMTEKEARSLKRSQIKEEKEEQARMQRLSAYDRVTQDVYERAHKMMLGGTPTL